MSDAVGDQPSLDLQLFAPYRIAVLGREISERLGEAYAGEGVTAPEWRVLAVIAQAPSVAARDVVALTPMDKMAVSRAVASLEEKGLVARAPTSDKRVSALKLTRRGRIVFERVAAIALAFEQKLLAALDQAERKTFIDNLHRLEAGLRADGIEQATRAAE